MEKVIHKTRRGRKRVNFDPYLKEFTCYYCLQLIPVDRVNIRSVRFSTKKGECRACHNLKAKERATLKRNLSIEKNEL